QMALSVDAHRAQAVALRLQVQQENRPCEVHEGHLRRFSPSRGPQRISSTESSGGAVTARTPDGRTATSNGPFNPPGNGPSRTPDRPGTPATVETAPVAITTLRMV